MLDFLMIATRNPKRGSVEIYPKFIVKKSNDLMIRGSDFYAIWDEEQKLWCTEEDAAIRLIDKELNRYLEEHKEEYDGLTKRVMYMWDAETQSIDKFHKYCQKQCRDNYHMLDENLIFANHETVKKDYASRKLSYAIEPGDTEAYDRLMSTLYSPEERHKIEWAIGSIITGDSKKIQKFMVLYGSAGTGKSTILNIIQQLFEGYYSVFDAKALGSSNNSFALEAFKSNPLVAIQHDGDLSKIEDNTRLNSLVSHELMTINEKFKSTYTNRFKAFLFMGTNKPVKITDAKSGLIRRLIDVSPTGNKLPVREYNKLVKQVNFELGAIAYHCREVYLSDPGKYDNYIPISMLGASNDFYNFVMDSYRIFKREDRTTMKAAWELYNIYCDEARVPYRMSQRIFKEELKNYFRDYKDRIIEDGEIVRGYYEGFRADKFEDISEEEVREEKSWLEFDSTESIFDKECAGCLAQYGSKKETPSKKWEDVTSKLSDLDTSKLHYVQVPINHIVIDFDIPDEKGNKCLEKNIEAASKWKPTYAELSKSGSGVHLHYIYTGDPDKLSRIYDEHIEIKVFKGNSSLRRKLSRCNSLPIATISSGLPLKGDEKVVEFSVLTNEKALRTIIKKNLNKEYHSATKPSIDFIFKTLEDAYNSGMKYDVSDMHNAVLAFAMQSTNQADYCVKLVSKMHFKSEEASSYIEDYDNSPIVFFDTEIFPNLFLINWKFEGEDKPVVRMINPKPEDVEDFIKMKLVGFNNRRYDNHILWARMMGYSNEELFKLSQRLINSKKGDRNNGTFSEAFNLSYTDIYDFASAGNKKSLKKWEIELGIHHEELALPWDEPVPEDKWEEVAKYCDNDVLATEAVFHHLKGDWLARQILADISGLSVNDTTNTLSTRIIFGTNRKPQSEFNYRDLSKPIGSNQYEEYRRKFGEDYIFRVFDDDGLPLYRDYIPGEKLPKGYSILPFFPGYTFENGVSTYLDEKIGEGGKVYSEPGMYGNVWDADVTGQHPSSIIAEVLFGPRYTKTFKDIVYGRVSIKHQAWDDINDLFDGKLRPYVQKVIDGELTVKELANALKTVVNSVYGLTSASFENPFRDPRNKDNIVAKRGALFMTLLKREVQKLGYTVAHIKTDSIKIPDADDRIREFVLKFGKEFGYDFETEAEFDKFCLVNDAVYIAKEKGKSWTATGTQFAVPYVFKTLFSKEPILFEDLCEAKQVQNSAIYLDMNENLPEGEHDYQFVGRIGNFCPIKPGFGGGELVRSSKAKDGSLKYDAVTGTKGYRWLEAEKVLVNKDARKSIDESYYRNLVDKAVESISQYGDFEWFASDEPYEGSLLQIENTMPFNKRKEK